jgi:Na+-driven multidrug efflux pump
MQVAMMFAIGLAVANSTLVGQNLGANDIRQASRVAKLSSFIGFISLSVIGVIAFIFSRQFISFFVPNDLVVINGGVVFVKSVSLSFGFIALHMVFSNVLVAAGKTTTTMLLTILSQWLFQIAIDLLPKIFHGL